MNTTNLFLENYYDFHNTSYYQILTLNNIPNGPLKNYIKLILKKIPLGLLLNLTWKFY